MTDERELEELVGEFVERRERGERLTAEGFAGEHPGRGPELLRALRELSATEALFPTGAPDLPARVGPYRVRGEIGRGGMGRVLAVEHPDRPGVPIALKLLHVSLEHQPRALERFRREGKALERIAHPGIVRVHEAGLLDDRPYLAMELVEGTPLAECLRRARERRESAAGERTAVEWLELPGEGLPLERAVRLVARIARALAAAHREGVLHRDLNPRNVLVRADGEPVVIDFGLMRAAGDPTLTGSGDLLGTPQYMAPEQARGERVDERSDVFGLGTILWECLTLEPPRASAETLALVREASTRPLPRLRARAPGLPRELETVVHRALAFFPRFRYPSSEELAADLERFLEGERVLARPARPHERALELWAAHRRAAAVALSALLFALAGLLVWYARRADEQELQLRRMNAVVIPWLDGDLARAREALATLQEEHADPPLAGFLAALAADDLARESGDPATRALLEGERARRAGRSREALERFYTASDLRPGSPVALLFQGLAALEAGELAIAREKLEYVAHYYGPALRMHLSLADVYERLGLFADACRALNAALAVAPDDGEAWLALARARLELGDARAALEAGRRAAALDLDALRPGLEALASSLAMRGAAEEAAQLEQALVER